MPTGTSCRSYPEDVAPGDSLLRPASLLERARQPVVFVMVGALNTAFGYGVFVLGILIGVAPLLSLLVSTVLGVAFNFFTTGRIVFGNSDPRRFGLFVLGYTVVYGLNAGLLQALRLAGLGPIAAQAICVVPIALVGFAIMKQFVFRPGNDSNAVARRSGR